MELKACEPTTGAAEMSAQFVGDFFPSLIGVVQHNAPLLYDHVFPEWVTTSCPELELQLGHPWTADATTTLVTLRNPTLIPHQLTGAAVGLWGAARFSRTPGTGLAALAYLFFALMNLDSILCHALLQRNTPPWCLAAAVDVAFTGAAAATLALAACWPAPRTAHVAAYAALLTPTALLAAVAGNRQGLPFVNEAIYLGSVALAAAVLLAKLGRSWHLPGYFPWFAVALGGAGLAAGAVLADRAMCAALGPLHGMVHLFFMGCNIAFLGVGRFLLAHPKPWVALAGQAAAARSPRQPRVKSE